MTNEIVEFRHPFRIAAHPAALPAGCYRVDTEQEMLDGLSFPAWRLTGMTISRHGLASGRVARPYSITPSELATVLATDAAMRR
ncbi:hypothetical protein [Neoroseomonas oryzicola]|uniref:Uncharacterized protein n=1 Tax=Neoroseomonas oryzicola TaxID=535904 RepID=A0A9X9WEC3_9PROT|nr:hypothetical protein [Neoroseomonas oryzicola]MBR0658683.1 hypothetical protein [Neoroseomonas oryzicola]NKE17881.1 hypothetical protein [Neoroseomonas oryzicola]